MYAHEQVNITARVSTVANTYPTTTMTSSAVTILLLTVVCFGIGLCDILFHINISPNQPCPSDSDHCFTLPQFVNDFKNLNYRESKMTLAFLSGNHTLSSQLLFQNFTMVSLFSQFEMSSNSTESVIICDDNGRLEFLHVLTVQVSRLTFIGCTGNNVEDVNQFLLEDSNFIGEQVKSGRALTLYFTSAVIVKSSFSHYDGDTYETVWCRDRDYKRFEITVTAGGAIFMRSSNVTIELSRFEGNRAVIGGAIYTSDSDTLIIINCTFVENNATLTLPASHNNIININSCYDVDGGALYAKDIKNVTLFDSNFTNNHAQFVGGAVEISSGSETTAVTITDSEFNGNRADSSSGAVNVYIYSELVATVTITVSEFNGNRAGFYCGAVGVFSESDSATTVIITDSKLNGNRANSGGAVCVHVVSDSASKVTINGSELNGNRADYGGALDIVVELIFNSLTFLTISQTNFSNNNAHFGGVLYCVQCPKTKISNSEFVSNHADQHGGVIVHFESGELTISNSSFIENRANGTGGVLQTSGVTVRSHNVQFINNSASEGGGVIYSENSNIDIFSCEFTLNSVDRNGYGGVAYLQQDTVTVFNTFISRNRAELGGVMWAQRSTIETINVTFIDNSADSDGGVFYTDQTITTISQSNLSNNHADNNGGTVFADGGSTQIINSTFSHNRAGSDGAVMRAYLNELKIIESDFNNNSAVYEGGVLWTDQCSVNIIEATFSDNTADCGGAIHLEMRDTVLNMTSFTNNTANAGGVLWASRANITSFSTNITTNSAKLSVLYLLLSNTVWSSMTLSDNIGSMLSRGSVVIIEGDSYFVNNIQPPHMTTETLLLQGGAITAVIQSNIILKGICQFKNNSAEKGGALNVIGSMVDVHGKVTITTNRATVCGGGMYLYHSSLTSREDSTLTLFHNKGTEKGGGVMAISSSITINVNNSENIMNIAHNKAENGGGFYFKLNTVFTILKSDPNTSHHEIVLFNSNLAHEHGGAIYLSDDGMCTLSSVSDCSFQVYAMYQPMPFDYDLFDSRCTSILFYNNTAKDGGNSLFGGLLNMCTVSTFAEPNINNVNMDYSFSNGSLIVSGTEYLQSISNILESDISSEPVRVCFCREGEGLPDCNFQLDPIEIRRGQQKNVTITLAVVDQLYNPLNDIIVYSHFGSGNFLCQNHLQNTDGKCTKIDFAVESFNDTEELILSLNDGPCEHNPDSKANVSLHFSCSQCPIGFEEDNTRTGCYCSCDSKLFPYFTNCSEETIIREENVWITSINASGSDTTYHYLIHPYCPLNYCQPPSSRIRINLNTPNGVDLQCADNRSGLLCSTCKPGLSLSLGSSRCIRCPDHWPIILAVIITCACLAGLLLVAFLLIFNLTVAVGTLNAIIFYSNIVFANQSTFFPSTTSKFVTIFISWLNLEIGFDICFFDGLDTFAKAFLHLAFPGYVILLVILVIILSEHNRRFAQLIGKRNPIATLTTLILLSFAKLLNNIIASLSFTVLKYPTSRGNQVVWLYDATVFYLKGKHIALFSIALLILFAGVFYTTILFLWQWLLRLQDNKMFAWLKYQKLCHFIEPYHAPYAFSHRYWTGLLLLARVLLYIVFSMNVEGDPQMPLIAIIFTVGFLLFFKSMFVPKLYKKRPLELLEMIMFFNLLVFSTLTSFYTSNEQEKSQSAIAATSVSVTFTLLLIVVTFHVYKYSFLESIISKKEVFKKIKMKVLRIKKKQAPDNSAPPSPAVELQQTTYSVAEIRCHPQEIIT